MSAWLIFGIVLVILGIIGSIVPALPGPVFSFIALLILYFEKGSDIFPTFSLSIFALAMTILVLLDYLAPIVGAKFFKATKNGIWGAVIGGFLGMIFFPPLGIFIGPFVGAVAGELLGGKKLEHAFKAGVGTFLGSITVLIFQVVFSIVVAIYFFMKLA